MRRPDRRSGVVLLVVLFFSLLLASTVTTFLKRSTVDALISRHRDQAARADALARGGVRLAGALLLQDLILESAGASPALEASSDAWSRVADVVIHQDDARLRLRIEDTGARLNLNALFQRGEDGLLAPRDEAEDLLERLLEKVVSELPVSPAERALYDVSQLTENLIDFVDGDDVRLRGGPEDAYYQRQEPPYRAWNDSLLSVEDLRLVEGFDAALVSAFARYVSVYPFAPGGCTRPSVGCGVNLNTAPPWVLAALYYDDGVDMRLADEDLVRRILRIRQEGGVICPPGARVEDCTPLNELIANSVVPEPTFRSTLFTVVAEASVQDVERVAEAVIDVSDPAQPRLLSWRTW